MESVGYFSVFLSLTNLLLIKGMFITVLVVIASKNFRDSQMALRLSIDIIRWVLITYGLSQLLLYITGIFIGWYSGVEYVQWQIRATGPYWGAFWLILLSDTVLPLMMLIPKVKYSLAFVFVLSLMMNLGWMFELFVIHLTDASREYVSSTSGFQYWNELRTIVTGIVVGVMIVVISNSLTNKKAKEKKFSRL